MKKVFKKVGVDGKLLKSAIAGSEDFVAARLLHLGHVGYGVGKVEIGVVLHLGGVGHGLGVGKIGVRA